MDKMELRSSRSRSRTPFIVQDSFDKEIIEKGNHMEKSVVRTTRRTTTVKTSQAANTISSSEEFISSYDIKPERKSRRSEKNVRGTVYKTSDYSSEDGENEVSSTKTISQNEKNQLIEHARSVANGTEISALDLYRKSGRYWDVYPKTDWTYSQHSKDRVEIAPGVVAMPNMSRRTIHSLDESNYSTYSDNVSHKNINTEDAYYESQFTNLESKVKPRVLFNNNEEHKYYRSSATSTYWSKFKRSVVTVFTAIYTVFHYAFVVQTKWLSYVHQLAAKVMLLDTWLLWKRGRTEDKTRKLIMLCLIPLLLLVGWWFLSSLGGTLYGAIFNSTFPATLVPTVKKTSQETNDITFDKSGSEPVAEKVLSQYSSSHGNAKNPILEEKIVKITEKIYVEPPNADEIAASLSAEQLKLIAEGMRDSINLKDQIDTDSLVQKIILNPSFQNILNNYNNVNINKDTSTELNAETLNRQQDIINKLTQEVENLRKDIEDAENTRKKDLESIIAQLRSENYQSTIRLTHELNRCCRKPIINMETYVNRILTNILNDPEFLNNQKGFQNWLHSVFVAKQDLESHLANLTSKLNSKYDSLVEDNTKRIMDEVAAKLSLEMNKKIQDVKTDIKFTKSEVTIGSFSDEHVRRIVKDTLAIYDADKTGLVDYAMESMGGQIITTRCTENYHYGKAVVSVLGIPLWYPVNSPRTVITPSINPGECWAFQNFPGFVVIKLSNKVTIEAFSMEHISKLLVPEGKIDSAPREFEVYGILGEYDKNPVLLGRYVYDYDGEPLQFFAVENTGQVFDMIELRIVSNHGNPNYTCLYRFRVHGKLYHENR